MAQPASLAPEHEQLKRYVRIASVCSRVFELINNRRQLPVPQSDRSIDMSMERNCSQLRRVMDEQIAERFAEESRDIDRWERRIEEGDGDYVRREDFGNDFDAAAAMLSGCLLSVNMLARIYYERFPQCDPLFTVIRKLTESTPSALIAIFGDDLPPVVRTTWPHFTGLYELYCQRHHVH